MSRPLHTRVESLETDQAAEDTAITATAAELNAVADISGRVITSTDAETLTLTAATHGERIVNFNDADGNIVLPAATGSGSKFDIQVGTAFTGGTIKVAPSTDDMFQGNCSAVDLDADTSIHYPALVGDAFDTITLAGATTGGQVGDYFQFTDVAAGVWRINAHITQSGGSEATPFSSAISAS